MAEALLNDPNRNFWSEERRSSGNHKSGSAPANLWCNNFKQLYNTVDGSASTDLLTAFNSGLTSADLDQISVTPQSIQDAIGKLKCGKSDGGPLVSDHIIKAPTSICEFLARLFTSVLRHGFMPTSFRDATIQPIPKVSKDPSLSANYRGMALASSLSKVLGWSILLTWKQYFATSDLQFGFKPGLSTTLCTGVMKAVINRYLNRGSKVYACLIDASKAFDMVDHRILFDKLLERNMPKPVVRLLDNGIHRKANSVLFRFNYTDPLTKMKLFQAFCLSLYSSSLWKLDCGELNLLIVSFNNIIRRIWNLPRDSHTAIVHLVGSVVSIYKIVYSRFSRLCTSAISHPSCLIRSILLLVLVPVIKFYWLQLLVR